MKYRSKPITVEAMKFDRDNGEEVAQWCGGQYTVIGEHFVGDFEFPVIFINTRHGKKTSHVGDYIVKRDNLFEIYLKEDFEDRFALIEQ